MANGRHIENRSMLYFYSFVIAFGLRRAAAFVSSPIHLFCQVHNADRRYWYGSSVCLSKTLRYCIDTPCNIIILYSASGSPIILVFPITKHLCEIPTESSSTGCLIEVEYINFTIFDQYLTICRKRY